MNSIIKKIIYSIFSLIAIFLMFFANLDMIQNFSLLNFIIISLLDALLIMALLALFNPKRFKLALRILSGVFFLAFSANVVYQSILFFSGQRPFVNDKTNNLMMALLGMLVWGIPFFILALKGHVEFRK